MQATETKGPQLVRPGPIGLGIRVILGATVFYWFAALLTKWSGFVERDPIESGRLYTLFTIWLLPEVFALTFRRPWRLRPAVVFVAGIGVIGLAGSLTGSGVWDPVLQGGPTPATSWSGAPWPSRSRSPSSPEAPGASSARSPGSSPADKAGPRPGQAVPWAWTASMRGRPQEGSEREGSACLVTARSRAPTRYHNRADRQTPSTSSRPGHAGAPWRVIRCDISWGLDLS